MSLTLITLGKQRFRSLYVEWVRKNIGDLKFKLDIERAIWAATSVFDCIVRPETNRETLLEYSRSTGENAKGQIHYSDPLKPLLAFMMLKEGTYYLIGCVLRETYVSTLEEKCYITFGDINLIEVLKYFDDSGLLSFMPQYHSRQNLTLEPLELAQQVAEMYTAIELCQPPVWNANLHPLVLTYFMLLCSASPRLSKMAERYLLESFMQKLEHLKHNSLLVLEFVQKWVGIQMEIKYVDSTLEGSAANFYKDHFEPEQSLPVFLISTSVMNAIWHFGGNPCVLCGKMSCVRCRAVEGRIILPDVLLPFVARAAVKSHLHETLISHARIHGTSAAIDFWTRLNYNETESEHKTQWFNGKEVRKIYNELVDELNPYRRNPETLNQITTFLSNSAAWFRAQFKINSFYDPIVQEFMFQVWTSLRDFEPTNEEIEVFRTMTTKKSEGEKAPFQFTVEDDRLRDFANQHWPPCMKKLLSKCGPNSHLLNAERTMMSRFILDCRYDVDFGRRLWRMLFLGTDADSSNDVDFWNQEHGYHYRWTTDAPKDYLFPACKRILRYTDLCPFGDIEDLAKNSCLDLGNKTRESMQKYPLRSWKMYGPMSFALMTQET